MLWTDWRCESCETSCLSDGIKLEWSGDGGKSFASVSIDCPLLSSGSKFPLCRFWPPDETISPDFSCLLLSSTLELPDPVELLTLRRLPRLDIAAAFAAILLICMIDVRVALLPTGCDKSTSGRSSFFFVGWSRESIMC